MRLYSTLLALLCTLLPSLRAATDLASMLPEDSTFVMNFPDAHAFDKMEEHPVAKVFTSDAMKKLMGPFLAMQEKNKKLVEKVWKEEAGMTMEEAQALANGGVAMGMRIRIVDMIMARKAGLGGPAPVPSPFQFMEGTMLMHFSGDESVAEKYVAANIRVMKEAAKEAAKVNEEEDEDAKPKMKFAAFPDDYEASVEEHAGVKVHMWKAKAGKPAMVETPCWALVDKVFVVGLSERSMHEALDRLKKGGNSLVDSPRYKAVAALAKDDAGFGYVDIQGIAAPLLGELDAQVKRGAVPPMSIQLMRALGVDKLDTAYASLGMKGSGVDMELGITYHGQPAIMEFIAIDGPGTPPAFIPAEADSVSYGTLHMEKMMAVVEKVLAEADAGTAAMFNAQLDALKTNTGVDIKKNLLAFIGTEYWSATAPLPERAAAKKPAKRDDDDEEMEEADNESALMGIPLKDRKAFELSVNTLLNTFAPGGALFETREVQGFTVKNLKDSETEVGFVFTDDWLIVSMGPQDFLEKVLSRIKKGGGEDSIFSLPHVKSALSALPGDDDGTSYMDFEAFVRSMMPPLKQLAALGVFGPEVDEDTFPDKLEMPLALVSRTYRDADAFRIRIHLETKAK